MARARILGAASQPLRGTWELAALTPEQAKPLIDQSLASMATCPDKAAGERG